ncbi:MAG: formylglycine-generating enzyme family protein [Planctomycetota bacterium]
MSQVGYADLARAAIAHGEKGLAAMAHAMGWALARPSQPANQIEPEATASPTAAVAGAAHSAGASADSLPFWRISRFSPSASAEPAVDEHEEHPPLTNDELTHGAAHFPPVLPLVPWPHLWRMLHRQLRDVRVSRRIDVERVVVCLARGENARRLPRERVTRWPSRVSVLIDRSRRLTPFWADQDLLVAQLTRRLGPHAVTRWSPPVEQGRWLGRDGKGRRRAGVPDRMLLLLGDLGTYAGARERSRWTALGRELRRAGHALRALVPGSPERWRGQAPDLWHAVAWDVARGAPATDAGDRLVRLLAPAIRIEPGLLRAVRHGLSATWCDAGAEVEAWRHEALVAATSVAALFVPDAQVELRHGWRSLPRAARAAATRVLRAWHAGLPPEIWFEEVLHGALLDASLFSGDEVEAAREFFARVGCSTRRPPEGVEPWFARFDQRVDVRVFKDQVVGASLRRAWVAFRGDDRDARVPPGVDPADLDRSARVWPLRALDLWLCGDVLRGVNYEEQPPPGIGSALGRVELGAPETLVRAGEDERAVRDLASGVRLSRYLTGPRPSPPAWAVATGQDSYGRWADAEVAGARFRLRWIRAGRFLMGSPPSEAGRFDGEKQHRVTLSRGFWLAATPVHQALWQAVMGSNPSAFVSPNRPVERVSWEDAQAFCRAVDERVPGLQLRLPTEAEWEYACRAGTTAATYAGDLDLVGERHAPQLDEIAWYGGNSGVDFDLERGVDSRSWRQKQYAHHRAGTRVVDQKRPNGWGLFDMLGNVDEWCEDWSGPYPTEECVDPSGPSRGQDRVIRGGSWNDIARFVRAACRFAGSPGYRYHYLGFRCARGPGFGEPGQDAAESGAGRAGEVASRRGSILIVTDRGQWEAEAVSRPGWARRMGRDRSGLWAEWFLGTVGYRMRWIPPGRFAMGSPGTEEGRNDDEMQHQVTLTRGFWLGETPVTQALWAELGLRDRGRTSGASVPVHNVSWKDTQDFLRRVEEIAGVALRLPTEAEWEYACRAGSTEARYGALDACAWHLGNSEMRPRDVGQKVANAHGLFDMLGNVWELCQDWRGPYEPESSVDPTGPAQGRRRVIRGGSWDDIARGVRAACRRAGSPGSRHHGLGFRCARGPE